jgi:hypothetical protein
LRASSAPLLKMGFTIPVSEATVQHRTESVNIVRPPAPFADL